MKFAMKLILSLLILASFSSYLLADKDWSCESDGYNTVTNLELSRTLK